LADVTKYKRQLQALQESSQDADPLQQQVDKLRRDLTVSAGRGGPGARSLCAFSFLRRLSFSSSRACDLYPPSQEVRHLSEERQKQIYTLKQQLQKAHQRLDESSSTDSTILRLKEELAIEREVRGIGWNEISAGWVFPALTFSASSPQAVRTVKTFLTTKTKMVADKNAQIKDLEHQGSRLNLLSGGLAFHLALIYHAFLFG
jgi:hypothetical protein